MIMPQVGSRAINDEKEPGPMGPGVLTGFPCAASCD